MKKYILPMAIVFISGLSAFALTVSVDEIKNADRKINFINYTGKHTYIETVFDISLIGQKLSEGQKKNNEEFKYFMKYSIIHMIDDSSSDKYDAAVFSIDKDAQVDHINNLRLIISSYLSKKFGYTKKDADTLAFFVTIYNAVYRGNIEYYGKAYKPNVMKYLNKDNAGLSTKYFEWPGKTKILIPLTNDAKKGNLSSLNTKELTDEKVIDKLKEDKDKGIKERKDIVAIKEKEVENKTKEIEKEKKDVDKKKDEISKDEKKIEAKKDELDKKKDDLAKKETDAKKEKDEAKTDKDKEKADKKLEELDKQKDVVKKEEEKVKEQEKKLDEKKEEVKKQEDKIESKKEEVAKKQDEISKDKENIKKDEEVKKNQNADIKKKEEELDKREQSLKQGQTDKNIFANKLYYLKIKDYMDGGHYNNEMYLIDAVKKSLETRSELLTICGNRYNVSKEGVTVIAHQGKHTAPHYLILLDKETLKIKITGKEDIFWRSFVELRDDFFYAVVKESDKDFYLGKFNLKLELLKKSAEKIDSDTFISFFDKFVYINGSDKKILVLNKEDLTLTDKIAP